MQKDKTSPEGNKISTRKFALKPCSIHMTGGRPRRFPFPGHSVAEAPPGRTGEVPSPVTCSLLRKESVRRRPRRSCSVCSQAGQAVGRGAGGQGLQAPAIEVRCTDLESIHMPSTCPARAGPSSLPSTARGEWLLSPKTRPVGPSSPASPDVLRTPSCELESQNIVISTRC